MKISTLIMSAIACFIFFIAAANALPLQNPNKLLQVAIPGEFMVKVRNDSNFLKTRKNFKSILETKTHSILKVSSVKGLKNNEDILWVQPNYEYIGNAMEAAPNDPMFSKQLHLKIMKAEQAWDITPGSAEVIVAVTDNGFHLEHDDLKNSYWKNKNEIPDNGIDDDNNGYIDDYEAWNFSENNNDPRSTGNSHGTHVTGIIAAETNNGIGIAGTAPGVKVMPIKFYGEGRWTSEVVASSYIYAVNNGAKIITTSYNIDGFVNDQVYLDVIKFVRDNEVLLFNSAGNGNKNNPPRIKYNKQVVLVCSTRSNPKKPTKVDVISKFSNHGTGIQICAPGDPILSTVNGEYLNASRYGEMSGTSMAAPNAAAVAALIWSKYPNFTAKEVLNKLYKTADNLDSRNRRHRGMMGAGRVNALRALTE
jgi:serine protease